MALVGVLAASCSSSSSKAPTPKPVTKVAPSISQKTLVINGKVVTVPREEYTPDRPIQGSADEGGQIIISKKGLLPMRLFGPIPITVTWTNLTNSAVSITVAATGQKSPKIPPGGTWSVSYSKPGTTASFGYETSTGYRGSAALGVPLPPIPTTTTTTATK
jgi:hypothetical protein